MSQQRDHPMTMNTTTQKLELKLNHPPTPPDSPEEALPESPTSSSATSSSSSAGDSSSSDMSIDGSCVSSEADEQGDETTAMSGPESGQGGRRGSAGMSPMVLVGCPRCLMYVMLSDANPKCPKCKSTVLLDFLNDGTNKKTGTT